MKKARTFDDKMRDDLIITSEKKARRLGLEKLITEDEGDEDEDEDDDLIK